MKLYVIGIGPGGADQMTPRARAAIEASDIIAGYTTYIDLVRPLIEGKEILQTPMKQEIDRCTRARDAALTGKTVAMICSGDAGVYGMAGLMHEVCADHPDIDIEVVPGITAACAGAAVLGAPLVHDFAVISLSDLLTPWEKIEKRLDFASQADFCICLYNPSSKKRADYLQKACDIMLKSRLPDTPCGYVQNIGRAGECGTVCTLAQLRDTSVDMFTTVFIGNSQTRVIGGKLVTPRGYETK
ncbi:precorrin-3B C(17)-methyltransferase [Butyricicoccus porcorum]|uniref:Precorrin-3B C(17)-methyltransferase n=1 Tax=Butyricicoccus porcorum TaxID=1945634 RepID=A0A252F2N8_9FIRM|nr:precorrin-3B C(17)-methyltransferase [Butyricicoccus porcorum]MDD6986079.1 precorrin-3B C(17)-methyltransferase [Butyricicoccus porcorum]MDY4484369.1 precorrin-3B C(17)-methyltransferase [Butyricicoccus porcorum]OUM20068.1 precorrin-3B C(17)-methyltransferase [Butyricicoccus porcorum]